jgi:hypothetical protein
MEPSQDALMIMVLLESLSSLGFDVSFLRSGVGWGVGLVKDLRFLISLVEDEVSFL